jgi:hypothetical protein
VNRWTGPPGLLKRIHVDQHTIRRNRKFGTDEPPISIKTYRENVKCLAVQIDGPSQVLYRPDKPLSCGARLWIETRAEVTAEFKP